MKKIILGLGTLGMGSAPLVTAVSCSHGKNNLPSIDWQSQKDVDFVQSKFQKSNLSLIVPHAIDSNTGVFNKNILDSFKGTQIGTFPVFSMPKGIRLSYEVNKINLNEGGQLKIKISKNNTMVKFVNIFIKCTTTKIININSESLALANITFSQNNKTNLWTLTIGNDVGMINFDLSTITLWSTAQAVNFGKSNNLIYIGNNAFKNFNLKTIDLSGLTSLTSIGDEAFYNTLSDNVINNNQLNLLDLPNLKIIGSKAFYNANLAQLNFSGITNLTSIGDEAFYNSPLTYLSFSSGLLNLTYVGDGAFYNAKLTDLEFLGVQNLYYIGLNAFYNSRLVKINLNGLVYLETIKKGAFNNSVSNLKINISKKLWKKLIYNEGFLDKRIDIFGKNGKSITRIG